MRFTMCRACLGDVVDKVHLPADECGDFCKAPLDHHEYQPMAVDEETAYWELLEAEE